MSWRQVMGVAGGHVINKEIDEHYKELGFYVGKMKPDAVAPSGEPINLVSAGSPSLVLRKQDTDNLDTHTLYINKSEVYYEKISVYSKTVQTEHKVFELKPSVVEDVELLLYELL